MMVTSISAQISELIERDATMMNRAIGRTSMTLGVVLRAAQYATGTATMIEIAVPKVAMLSVSHSGRPNLSMNPQSGGTRRTARSTACAGASVTNGQIVFSEIKDQQ